MDFTCETEDYLQMTQSNKKLRIICMVPSWTEMLLTMGIEVIGRTRFCIEPKSNVKSIPVVGGTKDWDLDVILALKPDLLILDQDENPKFMSEGHSIPFVATHVQNISSCIEGILLIKDAVAKHDPNWRSEFDSIVGRWNKIFTSTPKKLDVLATQKIPGLIEWIKPPSQKIESIYYIIWKNPWMSAAKETFIGHVAHTVGLRLSNSATSSRYPELDITQLDPKTTLLLFSSEPYPFHKKTEELKNLPFASAIVDGQAFSWFGTYTLNFLEQVL